MTRRSDSTNILTAGDVNELLAPALNICRAIELDVQQHPDCPYRDAARKGTIGILKLMDIVLKRAGAPPIVTECHLTGDPLPVNACPCSLPCADLDQQAVPDRPARSKE